MQRLVYTPEEESRLMARLWSPEVADDPLTYVMTVYPWGQKGTPLAGHKGPRRWQIRELLRLKRAIEENRTRTGIGLTPEMLKRAIVAGRGIGKSAYVAWVIDWFNTTRIGSTAQVSANTEAQLRSVTWGELAKWTAMAVHSHWWEMSATKRSPAAWLTVLVERDLKIGTRQWGAEGKLWSEENPDGYAGPHNMLGMLQVFDEASGIPDSIWDVAAGFFTEPVANRFWLAFSNGRRNTGYLYETVEGAKREFWESEQIDARTVEGTDQAVYQEIIDEHGEDSDQARIEVYGQFPKSGDDQFINPTLIDAAVRRPRSNDPSAPIVIGVDPARGGDKTVFAVRQGRDLIALRHHDEDDTMAIVGLVIDIMAEFSPVLTVIDEGGVGAGVFDRLREQRYKVRGVNFGSKAKRPIAHGNMRAQMWDEMKTWLKTASILPDKRLKTDLLGPRKKPDSAGTLFLEGKKEMKARGCASPDCFVAGTMVSTPHGLVAIENICDGDLVSTPMGPRTVIRTWLSETESLTTADFSDGRSLTGKGKHTVFTWDSGWVRLDALSLVNTIETDDTTRRFAWMFHRFWFTRAKSSGFKNQVATTVPGEKLRRRDFFIGASGRITTGRFLTNITSIISTMIGRTTGSKIWSVVSVPSTCRNTPLNETAPWLALSACTVGLRTDETLLANGTPVRKVSSGTVSTVRPHGSIESRSTRFVSDVASSIRRSFRTVLRTVPAPVSSMSGISATRRLLALAFNAARRFISTSIELKRVVPASVRTENVRPTFVYNLTLDRDNVYYANGVLVSNCADAIAVTFAYPVAHKGEARDTRPRRPYSPGAMSTSWMGS